MAQDNSSSHTYTSSYKQNHDQNQRSQYPRPNFGQQWNKGQNMRGRRMDTNRKKKENPNMNKMRHQPSYADVTKMEAELDLKLAGLITDIVNAKK